MTPEQIERRKAIDESTSLPPLTVGFALGIVAALISATVFWLTALDTRNRQEKYIQRDAAEFALAQDERAEIRGYIIRTCIRHAVEAKDPDFPCIGASR